MGTLGRTSVLMPIMMIIALVIMMSIMMMAIMTITIKVLKNFEMHCTSIMVIKENKA